MIKRQAAFVVAFGVATLAMMTLVAASQEKEATRTGWISDQACGATHRKEGGASCVEKCWRGGAAVGHPEWKPQKAVFVADEDHAAWVVENMDAVKEFASAHVEVVGKFDAEKKTIQVEKVTAVAK